MVSKKHLQKEGSQSQQSHALNKPAVRADFQSQHRVGTHKRFHPFWPFGVPLRIAF
jgi:hypothetical protein